jgi:Uma2 family endonuclease
MTPGDRDDALGGLPAKTPNFEYQGLSECLDIIENQFSRDPTSPDFISDRLIIYNVHPHEFQNLAAQLKNTSAKFSSYDFRHYILTLKMASPMHGEAASEFANLVNSWRDSMQMRRDLPSGVSVKVRGGSKGKAPDASWVPRWHGADRNRYWPSMVVEVVFTETRTHLETDMRFWLKESKGDVKVAVSISVQPRKPGRVVLEQWSFTPSTQETRSKQGVLRVEQTMTAIRKPGQEPVISGSFALPFEDIFLKPTATEPNAKDLVITHSDMKDFAEVIWETQFTPLSQ